MTQCDRFPIRVYYEDTDHGGVVYHANYLRFMERARTEMLRCMGFELDQLERDEGIIFAVHRAAVDFRSPARFNDLLTVQTHIDQTSTVRVQFGQSILRDGQALCEGKIEVVCLDARAFRPRAIPAPLREALMPHVPTLTY